MWIEEFIETALTVTDSSHLSQRESVDVITIQQRYTLDSALHCGRVHSPLELKPEGVWHSCKKSGRRKYQSISGWMNVTKQGKERRKDTFKQSPFPPEMWPSLFFSHAFLPLLQLYFCFFFEKFFFHATMKRPSMVCVGLREGSLEKQTGADVS